MTSNTQQPTKIKLSDDERARIRWSNGKRGYVVRLTFQPVWGRRGARPVRALRSHACVTQLDAEREADRMLGKTYYVSSTRVAVVDDVQIIECDALGNVANLITH